MLENNHEYVILLFNIWQKVGKKRRVKDENVDDAAEMVHTRWEIFDDNKQAVDKFI